MTLARARVIKSAFTDDTFVDGSTTERRARRIAAEILEAHEEAARVLARARRDAEDIVAAAEARAGADAREREVARLAAGFLALREQEDRRLDREHDRIVELATVLAERLVGESIRLQPERVAELAATAITEMRGARRVRIDACPEDVAALTTTLGAIGLTADIQADASLTRGSLVVHSDLGHVDARLRPQLERLAGALREALR